MSAVHGPDSFPSASFPQRAPEYGSSGRIPDMPSERIGDAVRLWPHAPTNPPSNGRIGDAVRLWPDAPGSSQLQANGRSSNPALPSASRQNGLRGQHATDEEYYAAVNRADAVWLDGPPSTQLRAAQLPAQVPAAIKSPLAPRKIGAFWDGQPNLVAQERNDIMKQFNDPQLYSLRRHRRIRSEIRGRDGNPPPNPILQLSPPNPVPEPPAV